MGTAFNKANVQWHKNHVAHVIWLLWSLISFHMKRPCSFMNSRWGRIHPCTIPYNKGWLSSLAQKASVLLCSRMCDFGSSILYFWIHCVQFVRSCCYFIHSVIFKLIHFRSVAFQYDNESFLSEILTLQTAPGVQDEWLLWCRESHCLLDSQCV